MNSKRDNVVEDDDDDDDDNQINCNGVPEDDSLSMLKRNDIDSLIEESFVCDTDNTEYRKYC